MDALCTLKYVLICNLMSIEILYIAFGADKASNTQHACVPINYSKARQ